MSAPVICWFRRDLRVHDNPALAAAASAGPLIALFIFDEPAEAQTGAAQALRLEASLEALAVKLREAGVRLILRRGRAADVLDAVIRETGATGVHWNRATDGAALSRDRAVKSALKARKLTAESHCGVTLLNPWRVKTGGGAPYRVFTPFSRAFRAIELPAPVTAAKLCGFQGEIASDDLTSWRLSAGMGPAAAALRGSVRAGEDAAWARFDDWLEAEARGYRETRDRLDLAEATTGLSDYLALGEISPGAMWRAMARAAGSEEGTEAARRQLIWRDFAHMLLFHDPEMERECWRREWSAFPWRSDNPDAEAWRRGETGVDVIDAAMRELWVTGRMHNRARMLTASYLTKHLLTDWRVGAEHFRRTLTDWDPANNAMGWQWVAGCGPDASPFFRIFNPETQAAKFDPKGRYQRNWLEGDGAERFLSMRPGAWGEVSRAAPLVDLKAGRERALKAWKAMREDDNPEGLDFEKS